MEQILFMYLVMFLPFTFTVSLAAIFLIKKKKAFRFKPYISIPVSVLVLLVVPFLVSGFVYLAGEWNDLINILAYTFLILAIYGAFLLLYKIPAVQLLLLIGVAHTFEHISFQMISFILDTGLSTYIDINLPDYSFLLSILISLVIRVGVFVAMVFLVARPCTKIRRYEVPVSIGIGISIVYYLIAVVINVLVTKRMPTGDPLFSCSIALSFAIICFVIDLLVISILKRIDAQRNYLLIESALKSKYQQFEIAEKNIQFINMKCHDLRKQLRNMKSKKDKLSEEDFNLLIDSLNFYDTDVKTGSESIDSFIQDRILYCKSLNIDFTTLIDANAFGNMVPSDIYFLLVNIVDNAIEAVQQIEDPNKRVISLTVSKKQGLMFIEETNYYEGKVEVRKDGTIKSHREGKLRGYGTKSIAYIVNKYEGRMEHNVKNNIFSLKIVI